MLRQVIAYIVVGWLADAEAWVEESVRFEMEALRAVVGH